MAALLCVLLTHVLVLVLLLRAGPATERPTRELEIAAITLFPEPPAQIVVSRPQAAARRSVARRAVAPAAAADVATGVSGAVNVPGFVDWPVEGRKSAAKVLAAEAEAARIAKLFSGPGGTWASLTPRERSRLKKFRWKPGVDGLEYDEHGNAIYHISEGCVVVNLMFIGCALGKAQVHGDLFENMRLYFDERRLPPLDNGNGNDAATRR